MDQPVRMLLAGWQSYYVIVGSVAGALIGLQFVVMALVAESRRATTSREIAAFGTPTVLHFSAALLLAALMNIPWTSFSGLQVALTAGGVAGVVYTIVVIGRARRTPQYQPQLEDWIWHAVIPFVTYLGLGAAGAMVPRNVSLAFALLAGATLTLVFIGIHNSWDTITYIVAQPRHGRGGPS